MKKIIITTTLALITALGYSQNFKKMDSLSSHLIEEYSLPGIAIVGVKNNEIIYKNSSGKANESSQFNDSTQIYIASNTKAFIGLAMSKLSFEKQLSYNDPITDYIQASYFPSNIKADSITIRNLLSHTHGLSNDPMVVRTAYSGIAPSDLKKLLKFTVYQKDSLSHEFKYSNLGYLISGIIIEEITGLNWKEYLKNEILKPIGMNTTHPNIDFSEKKEVLPYEFYSEEPISSRKTDNVLHSAGGLYSSLDDMAKWLTLFTDNSQNRIQQKILESYLSTSVPASENMGPFKMTAYGNGWIHGNFMNDKVLFHFGSFPGYESVMSFNPATNSGVFVFVNERIGGLRIGLMLTSYFYLLQKDEKEADKKIKMFNSMIDPLYAEKKPNPSIFEFENIDLLTGIYQNEKYGTLIVDKDAKGFLFTIGRLQNYAYTNPKDKEDIVVEWTPGIKEHFKFVKNGNDIKLIYGDFGVFTNK